VTDWAAFAGFAGVVTAAVLVLSHLSRGVPGRSDSPVASGPEGSGSDRRLSAERADPDASEAPGRPVDRPSAVGATPAAPPTAATLLLSVTATQAAFGVVLAGGALVAAVPPAALGVAVPSAGDLIAGVALGGGLAAANEAGSRLGRRLGVGGGDALRVALTPATPGGWAALLLVVLPTVAAFEELLFRGALIGGVAAGYAVSPWLLAAGSTAAFALAHGAQGAVGVAVTGLLGLALAAGFVLTGSLAAVIVAHYLVNAVEFVVHAGESGERAGRGGDVVG